MKSKAALISSHSLLCLTRIHVTAYFEACFGRPAPECSLLFYSLLTRLSAGDRIFLSDSLKQSLLHCLYMKFYGHHYIPFLKTCKALFEISRIFEKSSNKCKTLLAKHHFIILHNSVCALLVNLHRLPLFSFCSLLILLYLCQSCQFFLEQFAGGFPSEHLPWVVVNPVLYPLDIVLCPVIEVFSLRYLPAYQSVLVLVAATLK